MRAFALALLAACASAPLVAQTAKPATTTAEVEAKGLFVRETAEEAVRELATKLGDMFLFPDKGKAYAAMLRANLSAGKYASFTSANAFASAVTADLQAIHKDGHLRVHVVPPEVRSGPEGERGGPAADFNGIVKSGWLANGVAYISFREFPGNKPTVDSLRKFIADHASANTLIIDVRGHRGGGLEEMDVLFPQLFTKEAALVEMDTRRSVDEAGIDPDQHRPSLRKVAAPEGVVRREHFVTPAEKPLLAAAKVYLLTSGRSASAAEHLALSLKRTRRATLVGETTRGAGNYGMMTPLDKGFSYAAFIPYGRTFDPDTGEGWEGVGVKPDVAVAADSALDEALKLAGVNKSGEVALAELQ